jgi:hypothetical protein
MAFCGYRIRQFWRALTARVRTEEWSLVRGVLSEPAVFLFAGMPRQDQRHGLDVLYGLRERGADAPELLAAALLHDVGKSEGVRTRHRVFAVLVRAVHPEWLDRVASPDPDDWRFPLWLQLRHAQRGADLAEAAGCGAATVQLIHCHEQTEGAALLPPLDDWLAELQAADGKA